MIRLGKRVFRTKRPGPIQGALTIEICSFGWNQGHRMIMERNLLAGNLIGRDHVR
jgi:hypothetical protein